MALPSFLCHSCLHGRPGGRRLSCPDNRLLYKECPRSDDIPPPYKRLDISNRGSQLRSTEWWFVPTNKDVLLLVVEADGIVSLRTLRGRSASMVLLFLLFILLRFVFRRNNCLPLPSRGSGGSPWMLPFVHLIAVGGKILWIKREPKFTHVRKELLLVKVKNAVDVQVIYLESDS